MRMLCTFSNQKERIDDFNFIKNYTDTLVTFYNQDDADEIFIIYEYIQKKVPKTVVIQKKTQFQIYFTINSLNKLIEIHNNYQIPWEEYAENTLLLIKNSQLKEIYLKKL